VSKKDDEWFAKNFPTPHAREAADRAIDKLDPSLPMTAFIDAWIAAYLAAGGCADLNVAS
jgi:LPS sulfotransferase NodH